MLNLTIAMRQIILLLSISFILFLPINGAAQQELSFFELVSPLGGQAVQGIVQVSVIIKSEGIQKIALAFRYAGENPNNWFNITDITKPPAGDLIIQWDTTTITDGIYDLLISVNTTDDANFEILIDGLRVRNYTPIETSTPAPTPSPLPNIQPTESGSPTPFATISPTATQFPINPAGLTNNQLISSIVVGGALVTGIFLIFGIYFNLSNRRFE